MNIRFGSRSITLNVESYTIQHVYGVNVLLSTKPNEKCLYREFQMARFYGHLTVSNWADGSIYGVILLNMCMAILRMFTSNEHATWAPIIILLHISFAGLYQAHQSNRIDNAVRYWISYINIVSFAYNISIWWITCVARIERERIRSCMISASLRAVHEYFFVCVSMCCATIRKEKD